MTRSSFRNLGLSLLSLCAMVSLAAGCDAQDDESNLALPGGGTKGPSVSLQARCDEAAQNFALGQATPSGMTSETFAKEILGDHPIELAPMDRTPKPNPALPGPTQASMLVELVPGAVFSHIRSTFVPCTDPDGCHEKEVRCIDSYSLPVRVTLRATDGSINEVWQGKLTGVDTKDPDLSAEELPFFASHREFKALRPATSFTGALKIPAPQLPTGHKLNKHEIELKLEYKEGLFESGTLSSRQESASGTGDMAGVTFFAFSFVSVKPRANQG